MPVILSVTSAPPVHLLVLMLIERVFGIIVEGNKVHDLRGSALIFNLVISCLHLIFLDWRLLVSISSLLLLWVALYKLASLDWYIWNFHAYERAVVWAQVLASALDNIIASLALFNYWLHWILGRNIRCEVSSPLLLSQSNAHALDLVLRLSIDFWQLLVIILDLFTLLYILISWQEVASFHLRWSWRSSCVWGALLLRVTSVGLIALIAANVSSCAYIIFLSPSMFMIFYA